MGDATLFLYEELPLPGSSGEVALGPQRQGNDLVVLRFMGAGDLEGHGNAGVDRAVISGSLRATRMARTWAWSMPM